MKKLSMSMFATKEDFKVAALANAVDEVMETLPAHFDTQEKALAHIRKVRPDMFEGIEDRVDV